MFITPKGTVWQSNQAMFDAVVAHLASMTNGRAGYEDPKTGDFVCRYRTETGERCAVGALIPDDEYIEANKNQEQHGGCCGLEGFGVNPERFKDVPAFKELDMAGWALLAELQRLHDSGASWADGKATQWVPLGLKQVATAYKLSDAKVDYHFSQLKTEETE